MSFDQYTKIKNNALAFQKGPLSQWWGGYDGQNGGFVHNTRIVGYSVKYNCAEQAMMHAKAITFNDNKTAQKILNEKSPLKQKELGRQVKDFKESEWDKIKFDLVVFHNILKFKQNKELGVYLLNTFPLVLVEAAPWDKIWGCVIPTKV